MRPYWDEQYNTYVDQDTGEFLDFNTALNYLLNPQPAAPAASAPTTLAAALSQAAPAPTPAMNGYAPSDPIFSKMEGAPGNPGSGMAINPKTGQPEQVYATYQTQGEGVDNAGAETRRYFESDPDRPRDAMSLAGYAPGYYSNNNFNTLDELMSRVIPIAGLTMLGAGASGALGAGAEAGAATGATAGDIAGGSAGLTNLPLAPAPASELLPTVTAGADGVTGIGTVGSLGPTSIDATGIDPSLSYMSGSGTTAASTVPAAANVPATSSFTNLWPTLKTVGGVGSAVLAGAGTLANALSGGAGDVNGAAPVNPYDNSTPVSAPTPTYTAAPVTQAPAPAPAFTDFTSTTPGMGVVPDPNAGYGFQPVSNDGSTTPSPVITLPPSSTGVDTFNSTPTAPAPLPNPNGPTIGGGQGAGWDPYAGTFGNQNGGSVGIGTPGLGGMTLQKLLSGDVGLDDLGKSVTLGDLGRILGTGALTAGSIAGSKAQADALKDLNSQYMGITAPSRARYEASFDPNFDINSMPGLKGAMDTSMQSLLRGLSTQGNPFGSPGGLAEALKFVTGNVALPALTAYRNQNSATGGYGAFSTAAPAAATGAIGQTGNIYADLGRGAANIFNPPTTLADALKSLKGLT